MHFLFKILIAFDVIDGLAWNFLGKTNWGKS
jgi:hypothetical protein